MKKQIASILLALMLVPMTGCSEAPDRNGSQREAASASPTAQITAQSNTEVPSPSPTPEASAPAAEETVSEPVIQISDGEHVVTFQLNDSTAAKTLVAQLPLSLEVSDYSNNEKIFYPPEALDVSDTPKAGGQVGTLAYYAPWADVVLFFGSYSPNGSLYELGQVVTGAEEIHLLKGTITIEVLP